MRLALAVSSATLVGVTDTPVLLEAAGALGVTAKLVDWRSDGWNRADAVLLHAPWDYTDDVAAFTGWLQSLSARTPVFNPYASAVTSTHKSYLLDLAAAGITGAADATPALRAPHRRRSAAGDFRGHTRGRQAGRGSRGPPNVPPG